MIDNEITKSLQDVIVRSIIAERKKQDSKWKVQNHNDLKWLAILTEEVGEAAELVNEINPAIPTQIPSIVYKRKLREELKQVAAVAVAWLECLDRNACQ